MTPSTLPDVLRTFFSADVEPQMSTYPIKNSVLSQSFYIKLGHPSLCSQSFVHSYQVWACTEEGERTSQEKLMMFVMSLSVDSSRAAKSLDSHSQAITHTQCGSHKLAEGLLVSEDALI